MKGVFKAGGNIILFLLCALPSTLMAHVAEGEGEALQLYSYRLTGAAPVIDGSAFSRDGDPSVKDALGEWKEAYVRQIKLSDGTVASLFLCNTDDSLYIAVNYEHGNNGAGAGVYLYFDEGDNGSNDGEHDHTLGAINGDRNEAAYSVVKGATSELSWNGSSWLPDGDGGILKDFNGARYYFNDSKKIHSQEFAIPLKTSTSDDANNSDLQISITDEIGFFINIHKGSDFYWDATNGDNKDASGWADIKLNVSNEFFTFYGTYAANGTPTVDGVLTEDAWRGSYLRDIVLTNFQGKVVNATLRSTQDHLGNTIFFGLEVEDGVNNASDYLQIYVDDAPGIGSTDRNYLLDDLNEDALRIGSGAHTDLHWNNTDSLWKDDASTADGADGHAGSSVYANGKYSFEGAIPYDLAAYDADLNDGASVGILLRYHDADAPAGEQEFYWDYGANADGIKMDPGSNVFLAVGWPTLQLGAPYVQVIFPEDNKNVEGVVNVRVAAIDENADGIDSAYFYRKSFPGNIINLTRVADVDEYSGTWDATSIPNGLDTLVVTVVDDDGIKINRLVIVNINNDGMSVLPPVVDIVSPAAGEALNGSYLVTFKATTSTVLATIVSREISVDGSTWDTVGVGDSSYTLVTTTVIDSTDATNIVVVNGMETGSHTVSIRVLDSFGHITVSQSRIFIVDNEAPLTADPKVVYPKGSTAKLNSPVLITVLVKDNLVGLSATNAVVLSSDALVVAGAIALNMVDDGTGGDIVSGDNVYSATATITTDSSGFIDFSVTSTDKLGNTKTVTSTVALDNSGPTINSANFSPKPEVITATQGRVYAERLILRGSFSDKDGSGIKSAVITITNSNGDYVNNSPIELYKDDSLFSQILNLIPGLNVVSLTIEDEAGNSVSKVDSITFVMPKATKTIGSDGGVIVAPNGVTVSVPKNALLGNKEITITKLLSDELPLPENPDIRLLGVAHEFGPDGQSFRKPVTVTLTYTEADLDRDMNGEADFDILKLGVVFWDGESWQSAGKAIVDSVNMTVTVNVNHFTTFDIAELSMEVPTELVTYWNKNPLSASKGSLFNYRIPRNGKVTLMVLDLAGDLVYQVIAKETPVEAGYYSVEWHGQNVSERTATPGIYVYLFIYTDSLGSKKIIRKPIGLLK
jgi:hypothetical protein